MARKDLSHRDASEYERSSLEYVLERERKASDTTRYLSVEEALQDTAVYVGSSSRDVTRVLFISDDESLLNPTQQSLDGYTNIADLFDEVHVLMLRTGIETKTPVLRVAENVWLYTATSTLWWWTPVKGVELATDQLVFADGFRPDLIVARDPFGSAVAALWLGKKYGRPVQVHVLENYLTSDFKAKEPRNRWRRHIPRFTLTRVKSIRTTTRAILDVLRKECTAPDIAVLPRLNNYESMITKPATLNLREKYKPFVFIMLYIGKLGYDSMFYKALDAARFGLRNPHLGMVVLGEGAAEKEFVKRAEVLGVREQVVFEPGIKDYLPYLKSANVLIVPDTTPESEEIVLQGAAAGIPMVLAKTPAREDIFVDGESALLCDAGSVDEFSLKLNILMNDVVLRRQMVEAAQDMIKAKFHENPEAYRRSYRASIEQVLFLSDTKDDESTDERTDTGEEENTATTGPRSPAEGEVSTD